MEAKICTFDDYASNDRLQVLWLQNSDCEATEQMWPDPFDLWGKKQFARQIDQADCAKVPEDPSEEEPFSESPAHCYKTEEERDMDAVPSPQIPTMEMTGKSPRRPVVSGASCNAILYQISASNSREQSGDSSTYKLFSK